LSSFDLEVSKETIDPHDGEEGKVVRPKVTDAEVDGRRVNARRLVVTERPEGAVLRIDRKDLGEETCGKRSTNHMRVVRVDVKLGWDRDEAEALAGESSPAKKRQVD
jgi:hypothetical protein